MPKNLPMIEAAVPAAFLIQVVGLVISWTMVAMSFEVDLMAAVVSRAVSAMTFMVFSPALAIFSTDLSAPWERLAKQSGLWSQSSIRSLV